MSGRGGTSKHGFHPFFVRNYYQVHSNINMTVIDDRVIVQAVVPIFNRICSGGLPRQCKHDKCHRPVLLRRVSLELLHVAPLHSVVRNKPGTGLEDSDTGSLVLCLGLWWVRGRGSRLGSCKKRAGHPILIFVALSQLA